MNEIILYGIIGRDVTAAMVASQLRGAADVDVRMHSRGGSIIEGLAIANLLKNHPGKKRFYIDGVAASIASYIVAESADSVAMAANARFMIHRPRMVADDEKLSNELRRDADLLDSFEADLIAAYSRRVSIGAEPLSRLLDAETWFTAQEAVAIGFADSIFEPSRAVAQIDFDDFKNAPAWEPVQITGANDMQLTPKAGFKPAERDVLIVEKDGFCAKFEGGIDAVQAAFPDVFAQINAANDTAIAEAKESGRALAVESLKEFQAAFPNEPQAAIDAFLSGKTVAEAKAAAYDAARAQIDDLQAKLSDATNAAPPAPPHNNTAPPAPSAKPSPASDFDGYIAAAWDSNDQGCRDEFLSKESFAAFTKASMSGRIKA